MDEQTKALIIEHYNLVQQQGQNLKDLAKLNREFDNWQDKKAWEVDYRLVRKSIDHARNRVIEIEQELYTLAGITK